MDVPALRVREPGIFCDVLRPEGAAQAHGLVSFPGETHELSRSGKPSHRIERLRHIVNWFEKYLKNERMAIYDLK